MWQLFVISRLDYCRALLAGLPVNATKSRQMIQNVAARLVFTSLRDPMSHPSWSHSTGSQLEKNQIYGFNADFQNYHWNSPSLSQFSLKSLYSLQPAKVSEQETSRCSFKKRQNSLSKTFTLTVPLWWNELPTSTWTAATITSFNKQLNTHLFHKHLTTPQP